MNKQATKNFKTQPTNFKLYYDLTITHKHENLKILTDKALNSKWQKNGEKCLQNGINWEQVRTKKPWTTIYPNSFPKSH